ncbi:MAG: septation regulator SpoVG [Elusimicrobia bacterium]|nr:septation regulator SpoVG [Elusimicrobiota bacterium]
MEITEVRIHLRSEERLKAFATITFDNAFVVHNMKVINGNKGLIVCMPSRKIKDGSYKDIAHPITNDFRAKLEEFILKAYDEELDKTGKATVEIPSSESE